MGPIPSHSWAWRVGLVPVFPASMGPIPSRSMTCLSHIYRVYPEPQLDLSFTRLWGLSRVPAGLVERALSLSAASRAPAGRRETILICAPPYFMWHGPITSRWLAFTAAPKLVRQSRRLTPCPDHKR